MSDAPLPKSEIILYQTEDGRTRIQCRFENDTLWLTQALIAELFDKDVRTINEHLVNIFDEGELRREATIRKFRMVRIEGKREVARFPNPTCPPSVNTSRTSRNIIGKNRFRRNTGHFSNDIGSPSMNGMFGIDATVWTALSGLDAFSMANPGRCPGLVWRCPVGAQEGAISIAPTGLPNRNGGAA